MVVGRSGSQKSGFALWLATQLDVPTLYFSADMSPFTASSRIASSMADLTTEEVESVMLADAEEKAELLEELRKSKISFSFGSPITDRQIDEELDAFVELWDTYPTALVFDNLMDFDCAESDYAAQMSVLQNITALARDTGATTFVMHHASDKSWDARTDPWMPPSRQEVKGGMSEKPELTLSVALEPDTLIYRMATLKQRMGPSDPTGRRFIRLRCEPDKTRFHRA